MGSQPPHRHEEAVTDTSPVVVWLDLGVSACVRWRNTDHGAALKADEEALTERAEDSMHPS
jgi:hypothetical protein